MARLVKFKVGDRVRSLAYKTEHTIRITKDHRTWQSIWIDDRLAGYPCSAFELVEIVDSPLYRALNEDGNHD